MNKLDKQFGQIVKGMKIDSPSSDFRIKVMSRIQAEAAVTQRPLLVDYKPVISKRTWIILIGMFVAAVVFIILQAFKSEPSAVDSGVLTTMADSVSKVNNSLLQKGYGLFSSVPTVAYLIVLASLSLWTLDSVLTRFKRRPSEIHAN
jgi:hypothetical protein